MHRLLPGNGAQGVEAPTVYISEVFVGHPAPFCPVFPPAVRIWVLVPPEVDKGRMTTPPLPRLLPGGLLMVPAGAQTVAGGSKMKVLAFSPAITYSPPLSVTSFTRGYRLVWVGRLIPF